MPAALRPRQHCSGACTYVQVASALAARHIGGAVNYVGVAETLTITPSAQSAGMAADSLICAFYFAGLFKLASKIGPDVTPEQGSADAADQGGKTQQDSKGIQVNSLIMPLHTSDPQPCDKLSLTCWTM